MKNSVAIVLLLVLAGCAAQPYPYEPGPCEQYGEASYACQVKRYHDVAE